MTVIGHACGRGAAAHRLGVAGQDCSRAGAGQGGETEGLTVERSSLVAGSVWRVLDSARCGFTGQGMESSVPFRTTLARHSLWPCGLVSPPQREPCDSLLRRESRWQLNEKVQKGSTKHLDLGGSAVELRLAPLDLARASIAVGSVLAASPAGVHQCRLTWVMGRLPVRCLIFAPTSHAHTRVEILHDLYSYTRGPKFSQLCR